MAGSHRTVSSRWWVTRIGAVSALVLTVGCGGSTFEHQAEIERNGQMPAGDVSGTQLNGWTFVASDSPITVTFDDGRVSVSASCGQISGAFEVADNTLVVDGVGGVLDSCPPALAAQLEYLAELLMSRPRLWLANRTLSLSSDVGGLELSSCRGQCDD
jgi:heat shock protein HslJ